MATFRDAVKRLQVIYDACVAQDQQKPGKSGPGDEFSEGKSQIHDALKNIRLMLKERDDLAGTKGTSIETAEASYRIRIALRTVREDAQKLQDLQAKQERKAGKRGDQEQIELSQRRREIVELAWKHIEECEGLEKRRFGEKSGGDRLMLLSGGSVGGGRQDMRYRPPNLNSDILATSSIGVAGSGYRDPYLDSDLPDLGAAEDMKQIRLNDDLIDRELDEIKMGVAVLKDLATGMDTELDKQNQMLDDITVKVDDQLDRLDNINVRMKTAVEKVMKGDRFVINCILLCMLLCLVAFIVTIFL